MAVAEAKKEKLEKENKHLNKQLLAAHKQLLAAQASRASFAETVLGEVVMKTEKIGNMAVDIARLEKECELYVQQCAKFEMQYCTRTVLHGPLREVLPQNPSTGGEGRTVQAVCEKEHAPEG